MIRPVSNDADLRLMLGGIGDAGQAHDGSHDRTVHVRTRIRILGLGYSDSDTFSAKAD